jgi:catechol 2,3-dioxygenase-like lactoylglutathione lyase family enzyme
MSNLELVALVVRDYEAAIQFFVQALQFQRAAFDPVVQ